MKKIVYIVLVAMLLLCSCNNVSNVETTTTATVVTESESPETVTKEYPAGMYKIGKDMPAGEYVLFMMPPAINAYFKVSLDSDPESNSESVSEYFGVSTILSVSDGEYLELMGCYAVPMESNPPIDTSDEGMFIVGKHIAPGEYKATVKYDIAGSTMGVIRIYKDSTHRYESEISSDYVQGTKYLTFKEGQYVSAYGCVLTLEDENVPMQSNNTSSEEDAQQESLSQSENDYVANTIDIEAYQLLDFCDLPEDELKKAYPELSKKENVFESVTPSGIEYKVYSVNACKIEGEESRLRLWAIKKDDEYKCLFALAGTQLSKMDASILYIASVLENIHSSITQRYGEASSTSFDQEQDFSTLILANQEVGALWQFEDSQIEYLYRPEDNSSGNNLMILSSIESEYVHDNLAELQEDYLNKKDRESSDATSDDNISSEVSEGNSDVSADMDLQDKQVAEFTSIKINAESVGILIQEGDKYDWYYSGDEDLKPDIKVINGKLVITQTSESETTIINGNSPIITVTVPEDVWIQISGETMSGDIMLENLNVDDADLETMSGDIEISGGKIKTGTFESMSGDIDIIADSSEYIKADSMSGDIDILVLDGSGTYDTDTSSGKIKINGERK